MANRLSEQIRRLLLLPEAERNAALARLQAAKPELYVHLTNHFKANKGAVDEVLGYDHWLHKLGHQSFTKPFAPVHRQFWEWNWDVLMKIKDNIELDSTDLVAFIPWSRDYGKCISLGTEILREDGTRSLIEDIKVGDRLLSINQTTGRCVADTVRNKWVSGKKECLAIVTRSGKTLTLTPEHRLWTITGWKTASELQAGERVAVPRRTRPKASAVKSDAEVKLTAYMIAEGCTISGIAKWITNGVAHRKPSISCHATFTNADAIIVDDFIASAASLGFTVKKWRTLTYRLRGAQQWLRDVGLSGKGAHQKRLPQWVFQLPERQRWLFLAAMIDTDGYINRQNGVAITLANRLLIEDLVYLFSSVGAPSTVYYKPNSKRGAWVLQVDKEATKTCAVSLPLILKAERLMRVAGTTEYSQIDAYPQSIARNLPRGVNRAIRKAGGPNMGAGSYPLTTRSKVRRGLACYAVPQWAWLEQADVFWDEITSIKDAGVHDTYDLQMSSASENFIANGIVSHNSTVVEWAAIAEGAMLKGGYVIYVSGKQSQAEEHVVAIRNRIEDEGVAKLYPWLSKPKMGAHNNKFGWARDFLMTAGGWAIRPVGLDVAIRGGKVLNMRPTLLIFDDIDELGDSPYVVENKERTLTRSILPMGTDKTRVLVAQNPIHANSMVNRMLTGVSLALSVRKVFGPVAAMTNFAYEVRQTDDGPVPVITSGETTWPEKTKEMWEATLQRVGPESFLSEYQHDMTVAQEERVLPEYDDRVTMAHVITWDQYEAKYGYRRIPSDWSADCGLDIGYTTGHKSAWSFLAKAPQGIDLAGSIFRYRGCTFTSTSIDDQSITVRAKMWPKEQIEREYMSHEKLGERIVLNDKHDWHFVSMPDSGKEAGLAQWRHYLSRDHTKPHPFHRDEKGPDGLWKIGCPAWFDIVDAKQFRAPIDDLGLKRHRDGAYNWRKVPVKLTEKGLTVEQPAKTEDDENDSTRSLLAGTSFGPAEQRMTKAQQRDAIIPAGYHSAELAVRTDMDATRKEMTNYMAQFFANKAVKAKSPRLVDPYGQPIGR